MLELQSADRVSIDVSSPRVTVRALAGLFSRDEAGGVRGRMNGDVSAKDNVSRFTRSYFRSRRLGSSIDVPLIRVDRLRSAVAGMWVGPRVSNEEKKVSFPYPFAEENYRALSLVSGTVICSAVDPWVSHY